MKAPISKLAPLLTVPVVLAALFFLWHQAQGDLDTTAVSGITAPDGTIPGDTAGPASTVLMAPVMAASREAEDEPATPPEVDTRRALAILQGSEEDPGTGIILGGIFDSTGVRISQARVLVFTDKKSSDPVETLELGGPRWEYRIELTAGKDYWLRVDPESLDGELSPTLGQAYVSLERDVEARMDLTVGRLATVMGRLVAADGGGIPGATARLIGQDPDLLGFSLAGMTDAWGDFSIERVVPGTYRLRFSRDADWVAPHPLEVEVEANRLSDVGDIRVEAGRKSIRGSLVDQDSQPFSGLEILCYSNQVVGDGIPAHDMGSVLGRATTDENGVFRLRGLPAIQVKISLTPNFNPNAILGPGSPAIWEPPQEFDLETSGAVLEAGTFTVEESRPFEVSGQLLFDPEWLAQEERQDSDLSATVSLAKGQTMPDGVRRTSLRGRPVDIDLETGLFHIWVETPRPGVELRFRLRGR